MNPQVDTYLNDTNTWQKEMKQLRSILLDCGLTEDFKWELPCYTYQGGNIVVVQGFKAYCALLFPKGVLLRDSHDILKKTGANTRVGRQMRFNNLQEIHDQETILRSYIQQAIEIEKAGTKVPESDNSQITLPDELQIKLEEMPALRTAWEALTPGRQRGYIYHFSSAKNSATRESRIEKCIDRILDGIGFNEQY